MARRKKNSPIEDLIELLAMLPVLDGHATWREIGSDTAELLRALGVEVEEAQRLARGELPGMAAG